MDIAQSLNKSQWERGCNGKNLYLHGFASFYKSSSDKVQALSQLDKVVGLDLDYSQGAEHVTKLAIYFVEPFYTARADVVSLPW